MNETLPESKAGPHDLLIEVLGTSFIITTGEEPEYLEEVLAQYRMAVASTQNISNIEDPLKVAILTGFLLCDEINKLKQQNREEQKISESQRAGEEKELNRITGNMIACIDQVTEKTDSTDTQPDEF